MNIKGQKKGISLIILVITIIVMIILAAAIILSLDGSNIIERAKEAQSSSDMATAKEIVALAKSEWAFEKPEGYDTLKEYAESKLKEAGYKIGEVGGIILSETGEIIIVDEEMEPDTEPDIEPDPEPDVTPDERETITFRVECSCGETYYDFTAYEGDTWGDWYENSEFYHGLISWNGNSFVMTNYTEGYIYVEVEGAPSPEDVGYDDPIYTIENDGSSPYSVRHGDFGEHGNDPGDSE